MTPTDSDEPPGASDECVHCGVDPFLLHDARRELGPRRQPENERPRLRLLRGGLRLNP